MAITASSLLQDLCVAVPTFNRPFAMQRFLSIWLKSRNMHTLLSQPLVLTYKCIINVSTLLSVNSVLSSLSYCIKWVHSAYLTILHICVVHSSLLLYILWIILSTCGVLGMTHCPGLPGFLPGLALKVLRYREPPQCQASWDSWSP